MTDLLTNYNYLFFSGHELLLVIFTSSLISFSLGLSRSDVTASSFIDTQVNFALLDHVIASHVTKGILACSHLCLLNEECLSFNFKRTLGLCNEGICELSNQKFQENKKFSLTAVEGYVYGEFIDFQTTPYVFTTLGAQGAIGPTKSQLDGYKGTNLEGQVNIEQGLQYWKVPVSGTYVIEALGASGGNGTCQGCAGWKLGGLGARIKGTFHFTRETKLKILVGQRGLPTEAFNQRPGGGGGGTFVTLEDNTKLIIAGGGGGGGLAKPQYGDGDQGQATENGTQYGGHDGMGGSRYQTVNKTFDSTDIKASSGAGYKGDGDSESPGTQAKSFLSGGTGGAHYAVQNGGFGGGGFGMTHGGGGGGYSGGGVTGTMTSGTAGGGGSFNSGSYQVNEAGINEGDGKVIITLIQ